MVRLIGLEPTRPEPPDPKSSASTNSATSAIAVQSYDKKMRNVTMREFLFAVIQFFTGFLDDGVDAALEVAVGNAHHMVGGYAVFGALAVAVVDGAG